MPTRAKIIASVVVLAALWAFHEYDKTQAVQEVRKELVAKSKEYAERSERATKALEASLRSESVQKDAKIADIERNLRSAIKRLHDRPVRPNVVTVTEIREACTGAQLYREDGEFLAREAARAERILEERNFYWQQYENARVKLEELNDRKE